MASPAAMKNELFSTFKQAGLEDDLKKHLRVALLEKLKQNGNLSQVDNPSDPLLNRVICSLIAEELNQRGHGYTLSVFGVQSGLQDGMLNAQQIRQMIGRGQNQGEGLLTGIVKKRLGYAGRTEMNGTLKSTEMQTDDEIMGYSIEQRLLLVDNQYRRALASTQVPQQQIDKSVIETSFKKQFQEDLLRFKQFELHRMRVKLGQEWRNKFKTYADGIDKEYQIKMDALRKRQKMMEEEFVRREKNVGQKQANAQKVLRQKIQLLDMKSSTINTQFQNLNANKEAYEKEHTQKLLILSNKTKQYDSLLLKLQSRIDYEVNVAKLAIQQQYIEKQAEGARRRKFVDEQYGKLMGLKDSMDLVARQNTRLLQQNQSLRSDLKDAQKQLRKAVADMGSRVQRLQVLKEELNQQKQRNRIQQNQLKEGEKKKKRMEGEILILRNELQQIRKKSEKIQQQVKKQKKQPAKQAETERQTKHQSGLSTKLQGLRLQRRKDIQKFKMDL